jgi:hypothetical protein
MSFKRSAAARDGAELSLEGVAIRGLMSPLRAYDVLGLGMHADMPGHTFILVDRHGVIRWRHDYTTMFVPPEKLLKEIPKL